MNPQSGILLVALLCGLLACSEPASQEATESPAVNVAAVQDAGRRDAADAVDGLAVAPGLELTLFASEPMLINPTNIAVDERGRVWVCEGVNYRPTLNPNNPTVPEGDRIVILEDTDADGKADSRKVFYQGNDVNAALGIWVSGNTVIVSSSPNVFVFTDTDGDDQPDSKELLFTGIGGEQHDHAMHAVVFGPDGKLYFNFGNVGDQLHDKDGNVIVDKSGHEIIADGDPYRQGMVFRSNVDGTEVEVLGHNFRNNYEVAVDSYGSLWQSDNDDDGNRGVRINYVMEFGNYGYQDEMTGAGWRERRTGMDPEIPKRHWHLNDPGVVPNLLQTGAGSPTGIIVYEGDLLPEVFRNEIIHTDAGPNVVRAYPVEKDGAGYSATIENIVTSVTDQWFRPSDVAVAPDGSLLIADWYDPGVGGHQMGDLERGRIFRVAPPNTAYEVPTYDLSTPEGAAEALENPNLAIRASAWQKLHAGGAEAEAALLELWNQSTEDPRLRARALWLLAKIDGRGTHYVEAALAEDNPDLRITGLRIARHLGLDLIPYVEQMVNDPSPQVRREAAIALRGNAAPEAANLWADLAVQHDGTDRWYLEALGIGAAGQWDEFFAAWKARAGDDWNTPGGRDVVWRARTLEALPMLATLIAEAEGDERLRYFRAFDFHTDPSKHDRLAELITGDHPNQDQVTLLALQHIDTGRINASPDLTAALQRSVDSARGTQAYLDLVERYDLQDQSETLIEMTLAYPDSNLGINAASLLAESGNLEAFEGALQDDDPETLDAALRVLGSLQNEASRSLLRTVVTDSTRSLETRRLALRNYGRGWRGETALLDLVKEGAVDERLHDVAARILLTAGREHVRTEAAQYLSVGINAEGQELPPIPELAARTGDSANGKAVFASLCSTCHVAEGTGLEFGPELSEIGSKLPKEALYTSIIYPDAGISFGYEGYLLTMNDGSQVVGYLSSQTENTVTLRQPGGVSNEYDRSDIASMEEMEHSLMTPNLHHAMSEQELVDLVEYLSSLKTGGSGAASTDAG